MPTFNDLLVAWLALKAATLAPEFHVFNWAAGLKGAIEADFDEHSIDSKEVHLEVEIQLLNAIMNGRRYGNWPWTK